MTLVLATAFVSWSIYNRIIRGSQHLPLGFETGAPQCLNTGT